VTPFITIATFRTITSRLLPRVSVYAVDVILYPLARPRAVSENDTIVQGEFLFWL